MRKKSMLEILLNDSARTLQKMVLFRVISGVALHFQKNTNHDQPQFNLFDYHRNGW